MSVSHNVYISIRLYLQASTMLHKVSLTLDLLVFYYTFGYINRQKVCFQINNFKLFFSFISCFWANFGTVCNYIL